MSEVDDLLKSWLKRVRESLFAHFAMEENYLKLHYRIGIPAALLAAIVGTSIFASLDKSVDFRVKILIGLISVVAAVLTGLQTFMRYSERAETHRKAAASYSSVRRQIETMLLYSRQTTKEDVEMLRKKIDEVGGWAPNVPTRVWHDAQKRADKDYFIPNPVATGSANP